MTGFDSEVDRRDAIRRQIIDKCLSLVHETIRSNAVTGTQEERRLLEIEVVLALLESIQLDAVREMMCQEIKTATQEIEKP